MTDTPPLDSIGIVVALAAEARIISPAATKPDTMTVLPSGAGLYLSGMGPIAAERAALALLQAGAKALVVFGVAGALSSGVRSGSLLCPSDIIDENGIRRAADASWRDRVHQQLASASLPIADGGALLSVHAPLLSPDEKQAAHKRFDAIAVDMESAAVAAAAAKHRAAFISLRAIVDEVDDIIPGALNACVDAWGRPRVGALLTASLRKPSMVAHMPHLYSRMQNATRTLHRALAITGPLLAWQR